MAEGEKNLTEQERVLIGELVQRGKVPLKLVTGKQITAPITIHPGAIHAEENATVIFVCG